MNANVNEQWAECVKQHSMAFSSTVVVTYQYQFKNWGRVSHSEYEHYDLL